MSRASLLASKTCPTCGGTYSSDALFCPNDGSPLASAAAQAKDPYLAHELSGHIEIRQLVGIGAMGRVYRAFQRGIDRDVAVKILHRELSANPQLVSRFHREAKVASRLLHPNVVQVHLAGQLPDSALYIVMEYLDGTSLLGALNAAGGAFPLTRALHIALQLCDAIGEGHALGIVHRDVKPENVMLVRRGEDEDFVKVLDFGIARLDRGEQSMATAAGLIFGTARYISPEGAQGEQVGPPGDVYAIATLLYQMLAGRTPFDGEQAVALLVQQIHDPPPDLRTHPRATYVPPPIAEVVMQNLAKGPSARAPDARVLGRKLLEAARLSGLSPEDLAARGLLRAVRASVPVQLPPMQQTKPLTVDAELAERLSATPPPSASEAPARPVTRTEIADLSPADGSGAGRGVARTEMAEPVGAERARPLDARPTAATARWTPDAGFRAQLDSAPRPSPSGVDTTLDDLDAAPIPALAHGRPAAQAVTAPPHASPTAPPVAAMPFAGPPAASAAPPRIGTPPPAAYPHTAPPPAHPPPAQQAAHRAHEAHAPRPSAGYAAVTSPPSSERSIAPPRARAVAIFVACFLLGVLGATAVVHRFGLLDRTTAAPSGDALLARARAAFDDKRWDAPPGDNLKDLTDEALSRAPSDARFTELRQHAANELVTLAVERHYAGDLPEALRLVRLARDFDPTEASAERLAREYEREMQRVEADRARERELAPLASAQGGSANARTPPKERERESAANAYRVTVDASPAKPRPGQPVELVARVVQAGGARPKRVADQPRFEIRGPGLGDGARLAALPDGTHVYRATVTLFELGKYDVVFAGTFDGGEARASRVVALANAAGNGAGDAAAPPNPPPGTPQPPPSPPEPPPAPTGSARWL